MGGRKQIASNLSQGGSFLCKCLLPRGGKGSTILCQRERMCARGNEFPVSEMGKRWPVYIYMERLKKSHQVFCAVEGRKMGKFLRKSEIGTELFRGKLDCLQ